MTSPKRLPQGRVSAGFTGRDEAPAAPPGDSPRGGAQTDGAADTAADDRIRPAALPHGLAARTALDRAGAKPSPSCGSSTTTAPPTRPAHWESPASGSTNSHGDRAPRRPAGSGQAVGGAAVVGRHQAVGEQTGQDPLRPARIRRRGRSLGSRRGGPLRPARIRLIGTIRSFFDTNLMLTLCDA